MAFFRDAISAHSCDLARPELIPLFQTWILTFFLFIKVLYLMGLVAFWHNFLSCLTLQPTPPQVAPRGDRLFWPQNSKIANSLNSGTDCRISVLPSHSTFKPRVRIGHYPEAGSG
jgi:hypothetical protein